MRKIFNAIKATADALERDGLVFCENGSNYQPSMLTMLSLVRKGIVNGQKSEISGLFKVTSVCTSVLIVHDLNMCELSAFGTAEEVVNYLKNRPKPTWRYNITLEHYAEIDRYDDTKTDFDFGIISGDEFIEMVKEGEINSHFPKNEYL